MAQSLYLREQAERCRRLARGSTDPSLREGLLKLADEFATRARAEDNRGTNDQTAVWQAGSKVQGSPERLSAGSSIAADQGI
jgi:hypothetical protein